MRQVPEYSDTCGNRLNRLLIRVLTLQTALGLLFSLPVASAAAVHLSADAQAAFDRYVRLTEARSDAELQHPVQLFWMDHLAPAQRDAAYAALGRGEVLLSRLETKDLAATIDCPGALIHHWAGVIFIPGVSVDDVLRILQDYDHQSTYYAPDVERSRLASRAGDHYRAFLRFRRKKVLTVVLNTEHDIHYFRDSPTRAHSRSSATRIAQIENPGTPQEREKSPGDDDGFLWKMETWWRIQADGGGVYVQSEVVSLTRGIPAGLAWLVAPFVTSIPKETLAFTLEATRKAVQSKPASPRK